MTDGSTVRLIASICLSLNGQITEMVMSALAVYRLYFNVTARDNVPSLDKKLCLWELFPAPTPEIYILGSEQKHLSSATYDERAERGSENRQGIHDC